MKNEKIKRFIAILMLIMMFSTSPSYAASTHTFSAGTNTITKDEYKNGARFKVNETGIYAISLLPSIEDYEWQYTIETNTGNTIGVAAVQDGFTDKGQPIYKIYSDDVPYVYLKKNETYAIKAYNGKNKNKLVELGSAENYVTINMVGPTTNEKSEYYEAINSKLSETLGKDGKNKFPLYYEGSVKQSGASEATIDGKKYEIYGGEKKADLIQQVLTNFFVDVIGDGIMFLIGVVAGEPVTIEKILFNEYSRTRLAFFSKDILDENGVVDPNKDNPLLSESGILPKGKNPGVLNTFFNRFTIIAMISYIVILLYMAIRIALSSTGKDMAKYKKLFADWVIGIMILFLFPYVMRYSIKINDALVSYIGSLRNGVVNIEEAEIIDYPGGLAFPFSYVGSDGSNSLDYMSVMRQKALDSGRLVYALCWFLMIKELVTFLVMYMKRVLMTLFLIVIFPLVTISYAIDKIGDGKSQAFNNWLKEYMLNIFLQTFHALNYIVVMGIIFAVSKVNGHTNFIFIIIGLTYLAKGDTIFRGIFSQMKGGSGGTVNDMGKTFLATMGAINIAKSSVSAIGQGVKGFKKLGDMKLGLSDMSSKIAEKKTNDKWDEWNLKSMQAAQTPGNESQMDANIANAANVILDKRSSAERIQQSVGTLRNAATAGGAEQASYEAMMNRLQSEDPEKYQELMDMMDQSDAVDALKNMEGMSEAEINAHLNVIVNNRTKKGNFAKLDSALAKAGVSRGTQNKLKDVLDKRQVTDEQRAELEKIKKAICTKQDAEKLAEMQKIKDNQKAILGKDEITKENLEKNIAGIENKLRNTRLSSKDRKRYESTLERLKQAHSNIEKKTEPTLEERKALFQLNEQREDIANTLTNKNLDENTVLSEHDKLEQMSLYMKEAADATGGNITDEQREVAEAQAILDGSGSGQYSLEELYKASQVVRKAKKKADSDEGIKKILETAKNNSDTAKPDGFEEQLAALLLQNKEQIEAEQNEKMQMIQDAAKLLKEKSKDGGVYQHILDEAGLEIIENDDGTLVVNDESEGSLQEMVKEIGHKKEEQIENSKDDKITDEESLQKAKNKLFAERLEYAKEFTKVTAAPVISATVGFAAAGMYAGAAGDYSPEKTLAAAALGAKLANDAKDAALEYGVEKLGRSINEKVELSDLLDGRIDKKLDRYEKAAMEQKAERERMKARRKMFEDSVRRSGPHS